MDKQSTVISAADVVLAGPNELDRPAGADRLGTLRELSREMHGLLGAAAEAAAGQHCLQVDLVGREPEDFRNRRMVAGLQLATEARHRALAIPLQKAVERLH